MTQRKMLIVACVADSPRRRDIVKSTMKQALYNEKSKSRIEFVDNYREVEEAKKLLGIHNSTSRAKTRAAERHIRATLNVGQLLTRKLYKLKRGVFKADAMIVVVFVEIPDEVDEVKAFAEKSADQFAWLTFGGETANEIGERYTAPKIITPHDMKQFFGYLYRYNNF